MMGSHIPITDKFITAFFAVLLSPLLLVEYVKHSNKLKQFKDQINQDQLRARGNKDWH
jgi:hypothetical protein